ncbi:MAG TPA: hypothetical protein PKD68_03300, partial [Candidatus Saccharibacteria bacterium]|nr:hypothetical protein [Candidatus Saccharibacteria bacterium]
KVMTMAAQLMAAGANQQLIAEKLEQAETVSTGELKPGNETTEQPEQPVVDGEMRVSHENDTPKDEPVVATSVQTPAEKASSDALKEAEAELDEALAKQPQPVELGSEGDSSVVSEAKTTSSSWRDIATPNFGGTLNATTDQAADDKQREILDDKNRVLLSHDNPALQGDSSVPPLNAATVPNSEPTVNDIFAQPPTSFIPPASPMEQPVHEHGPDEAALSQSGIRFDTSQSSVVQPLTPDIPTVAPAAKPNPTLADLEAEIANQTEVAGLSPSVDDARAAVDAALNAEPFNPATQPLEAVGAQPLGSELDHSTPTVVEAPVVADIPAPPPPPMPALPPLPDFSALQNVGPAVPPAPEVTVPTVPNFGLPDQPVVEQPAATDPGQFKLPGQS